MLTNKHDAGPNRRQWWHLSGSELANAIVEETIRINRLTVNRQKLMVESYALYGSYGPWGFSTSLARSSDMSRRLAHNAIANAVDSLTSEVTQALARPQFLSEGGSFEDWLRCKKLTSYCVGKFGACGLDELTPQVVRDGIVAGLGCVHVFQEGDQVRCERVLPMHILVDDRSCVDVQPRALFRRRFMDRYHLMELFPEHAEAIRDASMPLHEEHWLLDMGTDMHSVDDAVRLYEAYRLPTRDRDGNLKPGRRALVFENTVLEEEEWWEEDFPFAFFRPLPPQRGFWSESLVQRAAPIQRELNKLLGRIQDAMHHHARPLFLLHRKSGVSPKTINNGVANIILYDGDRPVQFTAPSMPADVYQQVRQYVSDIYDVMGVSEMSAKSLQPRGLDSGEALKVYNETESRRFINVKRRADGMRVRVAEEIVRAERAIAEDDPEHAVVYERWGVPQRIEWLDIDVGEFMRIRVMPSGALGDTLSGKVDRLEKWLEAGWIDFDTFVQHIEAPDIKSLGDIMASPAIVVHMMLSHMLEGGDYVAPEPYMDLNRCVNMAGRYLCHAKVLGADEGRLKKLRDFYVDAKDELDSLAAKAANEQAMMAAAQPPPPPMPPGPMGPPGPPGPPGEPMMMPPGAVPPEAVLPPGMAA